MGLARWTPEYEAEFDVFWKTFPRKTQKLYAKKCYAKARQQATAQELLDGIGAYLQCKPDYADICHPSTYLNQGRWMDEPDTQLSVPQKTIGRQNLRLLGVIDKLAG